MASVCNPKTRPGGVPHFAGHQPIPSPWHVAAPWLGRGLLRQLQTDDGWRRAVSYYSDDDKCRIVMTTSTNRCTGIENPRGRRTGFDMTLPSATTMSGLFDAIVQAIHDAAADQPRRAPTSATDDDRATRTYFSYRIDVWTNDGESIVEHLAGLENLVVARAAYRAACKRWPKAVITLRQGARVVEGSRHWPT